MRLPEFLKYTKHLTVLGLIAAGGLAVGQAQPFTNRILSTFDTSADPYLIFYHWWGGDIWGVSWDGAQNAPNTNAATGSGAAHVTFDWTDTSPQSGFPQPQLALLDGTAGGGGNMGAPGTIVDGYYYDLDFDIKFDPASARSANDGSFGNIQIGAATASWGQIWLYTVNGYAATNTGWNHVHAYIDPTTPNVDQLSGFTLLLPWQTFGSGTASTNAFYTNASQVTSFWLDNIIFTPDLTKPLNPPTLSLAPVRPIPGLNLRTSTTDAQYDRQNIATLGTDYSWVGATTPVTYSLTISSYPGTNNPYFETHIYIASGLGGSPPGTESAPDWNEPNAIFLQIQNNADGSASGRFMWKTNDPNANDMIWGPTGTLGTVHDTNGVLGTWSITFVNDTNVTLTSPSGITTNFFFPDAVAVQTSWPQGATVAYFGVMPNGAGDMGQAAVVTNIKITGTTTPINDNFTQGVLDPNTWVVRAQNPSDISLVANDVHWKLSWTLPDLHYELLSAASPLGPWMPSYLATNAVQSGATKSVLIPDTALPGTTSSYFRMVKRVATQLQVLLPGESNAPGTPTGKSGTPLAQAVGAPFDVVVNACDNSWRIVPGAPGDTIHLTSSDVVPPATNGALLPPDAPLVNGTVTFSAVAGYGVILNDTGNWTVTASDVTGGLGTNTSTSVLVQ
jgi:hypothetical protein